MPAYLARVRFRLARLIRRASLASAAISALALFAGSDLGPSIVIETGEKEVANGPEHEGVQARIDLPPSMHVKNSVGTDGSGLCVFATLQMCAYYQDIPALQDLVNRMHREMAGGGYPEKVEQVIQKYADGQRIEIFQYQGKDPATLDLAMKTGRPCGVTYGYGAFYNNQTIAHMVLLAHLDDKWAAIIDNNNPAYWTWMSREEFLRRWKHPYGTGWAYVLLAPPPPPVPTSSSKVH